MHSRRRFRGKFKGSWYLVAAVRILSSCFPGMHTARIRKAPAGDSHFSNTSAPAIPFLLSSLMCSLPRQPALSRHSHVVRWLLCDVKTLQGVQQQIWFLALSSLPRKHLQWPQARTQASCAAIPAFGKADSSGINIRQVEASPPYCLLLGHHSKYLH